MWIGKQTFIIESEGKLIWMSDLCRPAKSVMMWRQEKRGSYDIRLCTSDVKIVATIYVIMSRDGTIHRYSDQSKHLAPYFIYGVNIT